MSAARVEMPRLLFTMVTCPAGVILKILPPPGEASVVPYRFPSDASTIWATGAESSKTCRTAKSPRRRHPEDRPGAERAAEGGRRPVDVSIRCLDESTDRPALLRAA